MITYRKITVPIFEIGLKIYIFDDELEVKDLVGDEASFKGLTVCTSSKQLIAVFIDRHYPSTIVHEAEHIKNFIWDIIGYTPQRDNDEVDAYLLKYIYNKVTDVFYKHIGKNPKDLFN